MLKKNIDTIKDRSMEWIEISVHLTKWIESWNLKWE